MAIMINYKEIEEIGEAIITQFMRMQNNTSYCVDIDRFLTGYLRCELLYERIADNDTLAFISNGTTPLHIVEDGSIVSKIYAKNTVVMDSSLLAEHENGRRRFTLAHEISHILLENLSFKQPTANLTGCNCMKGTFTREELVKRLNQIEKQANTMAAAILMPRFLLTEVLGKYITDSKLPIYGKNVFCEQEKEILQKIANEMQVSVAALTIRLHHLNLLEHRPISEYIATQMTIGGMFNEAVAI